jgi:hypothetical protein
MENLIAALVVLAVLALVIWVIARGPRFSRRGATGPVLNIFDEIWHPAGHRAAQDIRVEEERVEPAGTPDLLRRRRVSPHQTPDA